MDRRLLDIDLGFATRKRVPSAEWKTFLAVCAGHGRFRWKDWGDFNAVKQRVLVMRRKLQRAFGLEDDPFHKFRVVDGWRAKFFASSEHAVAEE